MKVGITVSVFTSTKSIVLLFKRPIFRRLDPVAQTNSIEIVRACQESFCFEL